MSRLFLILLFAALACGCAANRVPQSQPRLLTRANIVPLALDPDFSFRKTSLFLHERKNEKTANDDMISFERERMNYGAITGTEMDAREGHYLNFWWRAKRPAHLTVRLEYRQQNLASYVQAQEVDVPNACGTIETKFKVIGDDFHNDGRITAWRALLIENGKAVALTQSFLWN
jgi:hypothetical protein